ncbi:hypothetical protein AVEN_4292-1 [Araneus ventricosus]|uniref:Uncharacterized protein n=1 Tax=Araneus ventricosus TaxID=182803 RepID=A0A4Y2R946_ARAVE|nr:hypothetical protein AVEN_4292-1 [Araneus ventricosus]
MLCLKSAVVDQAFSRECGVEIWSVKAISHEQKFANPTLNSTVGSTQNLRIEFNLPYDVEVGVEQNTLNPVDFSRQSRPNLVSEPIR